ncbi:MAG: ectonucleotide pyrophosphatase/phosphodiesterase [Bacteroidota bacterium]
MISFDGFRWDYLDRNLTPNIDSLISDGVKATSLQPVYPTKTFPNHLAIVTGMYAENHGIIQNEFIDLTTKRVYKISDTIEVRDSRWYKGEAIWETARKQGKITASYFWPGSELNDSTKRPNYVERYQHTRPYERRLEGVKRWLELPKDERPDFIALYIDATDTQGHWFGPNSMEINRTIAEMDSLIGKLVQYLKQTKRFESTNILIVSDHGMTEIDPQRTIVVGDYLKEEKYLAEWDGPILLLESLENRNAEIVNTLRRQLKHAQVYLKNEIPDSFHLKKSESVFSILVAADLGWSLTDKELSKKRLLNFPKGNHGFNQHHKEMQGIFVARGPAFKKKFKIGTMENIDIYPLLCKILKIQQNVNIDGKLKRVESLLE